MGGRGGNSGGGISPQGKEVSKMGAKIYYNAAKKSVNLQAESVKIDRKLEKIAQNGNLEFIDAISSKEEALRVSHYYLDRVNDTKKKIVELGSADALYKNQNLAKEYRNLLEASNKAHEKTKEFSKKPEIGDRTAFHAKETTTYQRARNRRINNFESWFYGK